MISALSQITFMQPVLLSALLALPLLWYILRVTPPAPKTIFFPATRFLSGLVSEEQTPDSSPWWLLLLRLFMIALMIIALARPVLNPADSILGQGPVRLVIDNDWAAAQTWTQQMSAAEEFATQAAREERDIYIIPTTASIGEDKPVQFGPLAESDALSILRGLTPNSWNANYDVLLALLKDKKENVSYHNIWISNGLDAGGSSKIIKELQTQGGLHYIMPKAERAPLLLRPTKRAMAKRTKDANQNTSDIHIDLDAPDGIIESLPVTVQAVIQGGNIADTQTTILNKDERPQTISFEVVESLQSKLSQFRVSGRRGAGALFLLDDQFKKRHICIAGSAQSDKSAPLIEETYFIRRALEPFAKITLDDPLKLIEGGASVIILPDISAMTTQTLNTLENWVKEGGLLLRFAGPKMADATTGQFLLPVNLRAGGRSLSGSLSWDEPQTIDTFSETSPFYGLDIPLDISISQQVLADPAQDLEGKIWAQLSDGTPFITASGMDKGMVVLIHTTANTEWSNFAISGLYVSVLKRIIQLAGTSATQTSKVFSNLDPLVIVDGYGGLITPPAAVHPLPAGDLGKTRPSAKHPPGLYGNAQTQFALNIGTNQPPLVTTKNFPISVAVSQYETDYEIDIMPYLLYAALILFCIDWLIMIFLIGSGLPTFKWPSRKAAMILLTFALFFSHAGQARASEDRDIQFAKGLYLAYIETGDQALDATTARGLESLSAALIQRTSVEPSGVVGLDLVQDDLAFFPLIYWAVSDTQKQFPDKALKNIQAYLDHGGTIIFDTRDQNRSVTSMMNTPNAKALRRITASLNIPPIAPIADDHVLSRSYYLLKGYPGRYSAGTLWLEQQSVSGRDNVSSVLIGSNDWAGAWADARNSRDGYTRFGDNKNARQQELSIRFGINLVMYALTGNYKADQVHIPHILERLGK